jgi:hypothetical protein
VIVLVCCLTMESSRTGECSSTPDRRSAVAPPKRTGTEGNKGRRKRGHSVIDAMGALGHDRVDALQWLLGADMSVRRFFDEHWEQAPLLVQRGNIHYFEPVLALSNKSFLSRVDEGKIRHGHNVHWSRYTEGVRRIRKSSGRVTQEAARRLFAQGFTAQWFAPQHVDFKLAHLIRCLEGAFLSLVGCSAYLTPSNAQGLAPHHVSAPLSLHSSAPL